MTLIRSGRRIESHGGMPVDGSDRILLECRCQARWWVRLQQPWVVWQPRSSGIMRLPLPLPHGNWSLCWQQQQSEPPRGPMRLQRCLGLQPAWRRFWGHLHCCLGCRLLLWVCRLPVLPQRQMHSMWVPLAPGYIASLDSQRVSETGCASARMFNNCPHQGRPQTNDQCQ